MKTRLEHANLTVRNADVILGFVRTAFPDFRIRFDGKGFEGERLVHVGNDDTYLALHEARREPAERWVPYGGRPGLNHLGYEVADAAALRERMKGAGYEETTVPNAHPHRRRVYFEDPEGNDWEFVEYLSDEPALRNDYEIEG
jgi:catechol 2,3-dioxygenase-like lactoylglutathione lyase family enzyme